MKTILSLDLSSKSTGWSIFEDTKLIKSGVITASSRDVIARILKITREIKQILDEFPHINLIIAEEVRPEEDTQKIPNSHVYKVLMWLQAAIIFLIHEHYPKVQIEYVYPSEWRKACGIQTGRGIKRESLKTADIQFVKETYGISANDDEADAIGIGHAYVHQLSNEINWE